MRYYITDNWGVPLPIVETHSETLQFVMANSTLEQEKDLKQARLVSVFNNSTYVVLFSRQAPYTRRKTTPISVFITL